MDQSERWNQFASTGKVEDYLAYRSNIAMEQKDGEENAGYSDTYRDDIDSISDERVR